jgi:cytochrome b pre-mRNA-processing protein 3
VTALRLRALWHRWRALVPARALRRRRAHGLYVALVGQARHPLFYGQLGVPDTPEGRFEMVALHVALMLRRLGAEGPPGRELGQEVFDLMFADMDASLREIGVGDLSVGRYVKRLAGNFFARVAALDASLARPDLEAIAAMLRSNAYHGAAPPDPAQVEDLAGYLIGLDQALASQPAEALLSGQVRLREPVAGQGSEAP